STPSASVCPPMMCSIRFSSSRDEKSTLAVSPYLGLASMIAHQRCQGKQAAIPRQQYRSGSRRKPAATKRCGSLCVLSDTPSPPPAEGVGFPQQEAPLPAGKGADRCVVGRYSATPPGIGRR